MNYLVPRHHWLNYFNSFTLTIFSTLLITDIASANPLCYMVDANGKQVNFSNVCSIDKIGSLTPLNNAPQSTGNSSINNTTTLQQNTVTPRRNLSSQNNNTTTQNNQVDRSSLPATQRSIPLLQRQRTP